MERHKLLRGRRRNEQRRTLRYFRGRPNWRPWRQRASLSDDDLLHNLEMSIHRIELSCLKQQAVDLLHANPAIGVHDRGHVHPIGPRLRNEHIRLELVEELLALLSKGLNLIWRCRGGQRLVGRI